MTFTPWKKSYDKPRKCVKKQRHYFADKGPHSQSYGFSSSHVQMWELDNKKRLNTEELMPSNCGVGESSCKSLGLQGDPTSLSKRKSTLNIHWKGWCWSWSSNTLATWCEELIHWKRPWCWGRLKAGEGDDRGWDGWMASPTQWTCVWASSRSWWWTGGPGVLQSMWLQRVRHDWATEPNWTDRASPSSATKNIISLISVLTIWWCPCVESSLGLLENDIFYDQDFLMTRLC